MQFGVQVLAGGLGTHLAGEGVREGGEGLGMESGKVDEEWGVRGCEREGRSERGEVR